MAQQTWQANTDGKSALTALADADFWRISSGGSSRKVPYSVLKSSLATAILPAGVLTASAPLTLTQTWNNAAVVFTGVLANITNTASDTSSLLMDLQVGGATKLRVTKFGGVVSTIQTASFGRGAFCSGETGFGDLAFCAGLDNSGDSATGAFRTLTGWATRSTRGYHWVSDDNAVGGTIDLSLWRDAADTLAQRNGTNAQVTRGYFSFTDASNYQRWALQSGAGYSEFASETAGTGADDVDIRLTPAGNGRVDLRNSDDAAAAAAGTLLNAPTAGNPTFWVTVKINGTALAIPAWALP